MKKRTKRVHQEGNKDSKKRSGDKNSKKRKGVKGNKASGPSNSPNIYLVVVGASLSHVPRGVKALDIADVRDFTFLHQLFREKDKHIYKLPLTAPARRLIKNWQPLRNDLHTNIQFERELTSLETAYRELLRRGNSGIQWDVSGDWSSVGGLKAVEQGVGVVGGPHEGFPSDTIVLGFTNQRVKVH